MELDHLFIFTQRDAPYERQYLESRGLVPTYSRVHRGQGTSNVCYAFDNAFLELLWIDDADAAAHPNVSRTGLLERSYWRDNSACPFGISYRPSGSSPPLCWDYRPAYLPHGSIRVALDSDDPKQPMMFEALGGPPNTWESSRRGALQSLAGLSELSLILRSPASITPAPALRALAAAGALTLIEGADRWSAQLIINHKQDGPLTLELPLSS